MSTRARRRCTDGNSWVHPWDISYGTCALAEGMEHVRLIDQQLAYWIYMDLHFIYSYITIYTHRELISANFTELADVTAHMNGQFGAPPHAWTA